MSTIKKFEDLEVWMSAREMAKVVFELSRETIRIKDIELFRELNKTTGSIMDNIAEGFERHSNKEFAQFLVIAKGSNGELRSQFYRALDRNFISEKQFEEVNLLSEILGKKINSLIGYLKNSEFINKPLTPKTK